MMQRPKITLQNGVVGKLDSLDEDFARLVRSHSNHNADLEAFTNYSGLVIFRIEPAKLYGRRCTLDEMEVTTTKCRLTLSS